MKRALLLISNCFAYIFLVIVLIIVAACGNESSVIKTGDVSNVRSIQAIHLVSKYKKEEVKTKKVDTFEEALKHAKTMPVKFAGQMTGYGPDCDGCGGKTGCPPRQDVRKGNIFFKDQEYGKVNIVATDSRIPCGSIIKITNSTLGKEVIAIALDRGGAIKGNIMDFLVETESKASSQIGRQKVTFEIIRWSW